MEDKNLKNDAGQMKVEAPPLVQEADEARAQSDLVSAEAHAHAGLAYLFELVLSDPVHPSLSHSLMRAFKSVPSMREDVAGLADLVKDEAALLQMHPLLLAGAMVWWGKEADQAENETAGSADWQLLPLEMQHHRKDLQEEFLALASDMESLFRGSGLDPELAVELLRKKCRALDHGLETLQKSLKGHRAKRKSLFYANSTNGAQAYYLLRVRRLKTTSKEARDLLAEAGEKYDLTSKEDRLKAQKKLHSWADAFESLVDALMRDCGLGRVGREYVPFPVTAPEATTVDRVRPAPGK